MDFVSVKTKREALDYLHHRGDQTRIIAGGTDVMVQLGLKQLCPAVLMHIEMLPELAEIRDGEPVVIGGLVTQRALGESPLISQKFPSLKCAATLSGGWQTQSVGTIGGNVCNASPAADLIPVLLVHDAIVKLESKSRGERKLPISKFVLGRRKIALEEDELLTAFELAQPAARSGCAFAKVGRRSAMEIAIVNVAVRISLDGDGTIADAGIAVGSVGPVAFRSADAEDIVRGRHHSDIAMGDVVQCLLDRATPIDDVRGSRTYRRNVLPRVFERCFGDAVEMASRNLENRNAG